MNRAINIVKREIQKRESMLVQPENILRVNELKFELKSLKLLLSVGNEYDKLNNVIDFACPKCGYPRFKRTFEDFERCHGCNWTSKMIDNEFNDMQYKSLDNYEIKGRGTVYIAENEVERNRDNNDLIGSEAFIDGVKYKIKGVESLALSIIRKGDKIGLLV